MVFFFGRLTEAAQAEHAATASRAARKAAQAAEQAQDEEDFYQAWKVGEHPQPAHFYDAGYHARVARCQERLEAEVGPTRRRGWWG